MIVTARNLPTGATFQVAAFFFWGGWGGNSPATIVIVYQYGYMQDQKQWQQSKSAVVTRDDAAHLQTANDSPVPPGIGYRLCEPCIRFGVVYL